jgi:hypothetical protein
MLFAEMLTSTQRLTQTQTSNDLKIYFFVFFGMREPSMMPCPQLLHDVTVYCRYNSTTSLALRPIQSHVQPRGQHDVQFEQA